MQEQIKTILDNLVVLQGRFKTLNQQTTESMGAAQKLKAECEQKLIALDAREKITLQKEHSIRSAEALDAERNALETKETGLENDRKAFNKECSERTAVLDQREADLEVSLKDIGQRENALEEDKATYKAKILRKLGKE